MSPVESLPRTDLRQDFAGQREVSMARAATSGRRHFTLTAGTIDADAVEFFGNGFCWFLAGAVHSMTGWDLVDIRRRSPGDGAFVPCHVAVMTPAGKILDIFGHRSVEQVRGLYLARDDVADIRMRTVRGSDFAADILQAGEDTRGDTRWWEKEFDNHARQSVLLHFVRLILARSGYRDRIRPEAQPPQPAPSTPTTGGTPMATNAELAGQLEEMSHGEHIQGAASGLTHADTELGLLAQQAATALSEGESAQAVGGAIQNARSGIADLTRLLVTVQKALEDAAAKMRQV
ncbi:hypothetical protein OHS18_41920 [Amycolatopsis sp. NBC_00355]|uniref:hypothetical protein n=1 Tax=Amycolatopsis sp. NBC_00355 TaxID=2975957 RepID=UPI002E257C4E